MGKYRRWECRKCVGIVRNHKYKGPEKRELEQKIREEERTTGLRVCNGCNFSKPLTDYHRHPFCKEGRKGTCKACVSEWSKYHWNKNAETIKAKQKAYRQSPHGRAKQRAGKIRYLAKPEKREKHYEAQYARNKVRRRTDPAFRQKKMDLARHHYLKRYGPRVALASLFDSQLGCCANSYCGRSLKDGCHVDHIMPLALGGNNDLRNLQFLCPNCNIRKSKLHPDEWERLERERAA